MARLHPALDSGTLQLLLSVCGHSATPRLTRAIAPTRAEWSFGYCPYGTGVRCHRARGLLQPAVLKTLAAQVYSCTPKGNPNYTFRESIPLGVTSISTPQV